MSGTEDESENGRPLDARRFEKMKAASEKYGGEIDMSDEAQYEMWESDPKVLAETLGAKYIRMRPNPDVATVFEEFIHTAQYRTGLLAKWVDEWVDGGSGNCVDVYNGGVDVLHKVGNRVRADQSRRSHCRVPRDGHRRYPVWRIVPVVNARVAGRGFQVGRTRPQ